MAISLKTHKMLWGRSGNMCAFPDCKKILVADETLSDDPSVIGEEAHIVGRKEDGPRGKNELPLERRDLYSNLILLCRNHHKQIDDQIKEFTVEKLQEFKETHENWVRENLIQDPKKTKDDELYAGYIEKFIELTDLHNWKNWTSWILGATEVFPKERFDDLKLIPDYIVSRVWPRRYPKLESALINFKNIVNDIMFVYYKYPDGDGNGEGGYRTEKFYRRYYRENYRDQEKWSFEEENRQLEKYQYHLALLEDLILELTRAANYICDFVREYIFEGFRLEEGVLLVMRGDFLGHQTFRVEYRGEERTDRPYPGLRRFMEIREERDFQIGEGVEEDYFAKMSWEQ